MYVGYFYLRESDEKMKNAALFDYVTRGGELGEGVRAVLRTEYGVMGS